jgi:hypothetical protein
MHLAIGAAGLFVVSVLIALIVVCVLRDLQAQGIGESFVAPHRLSERERRLPPTAKVAFHQFRAA